MAINKKGYADSLVSVTVALGFGLWQDGRKSRRVETEKERAERAVDQ